MRSIDYKAKVLHKWRVYCDELSTITNGGLVESSFFKFLNELVQKYNITYEDENLLFDKINDFEDQVIKTIAFCPFVKITKAEIKLHEE